MFKPVFISYSTDDTQVTQEIRDGLEAAGIACWVAPRDIVPGMDYGSQIIEAIEGCRLLVLVLSESANRSRFVLNEVERATSKNQTVIPFRIHNVQPSRSLEFFISNAQWIDALAPSLADPLERLVAAIRHHLNASRSATPIAAVSVRPVTFPDVPSVSTLTANRRSNLPTPSTPFVGRAREVTEITHKLTDPACRLLTLAGHGGIGKSRLGLEVARVMLEWGTLTRDGVCFVALDSLTAPQQMPFAIANALDLSFASQSDADDLLLTFLAEKQLLLVLDNFEHLLAGADLVAEILAAAHEVRILVTSREALNLQEEWFHAIGGLDLPAVGGSVEQALESDAVRLFALCARRAQSTFDLTAEAGCVAQLCRLVDGTPLALELAAAWLRSLTCAQIVQELQSNLDLLATTMRNVPQRHRSMEAVFEQSWLLLLPRERNVLCQLAVFEGGFDWAAAQSVTGVSRTMLTRLVDSSWVRMSGEGRYELVPLVRSYLLLRLQDDYSRTAGEDADGVRDRHSHYFAGQLHAMSARQREHETANLRAGWRHALAHLGGNSFLQFVTQVLSGLLLRKGWADSYQEAEELMVASERRLRAAMAGQEGVLRKDETQRALAELLFQRAIASNRAGLSQRAEAHCREGLAMLEKLNEHAVRDLLRIQALPILAWIFIGQSRLPEAEQTANQALAESLSPDDWESQAHALHYLAYSVEEQGRFSEAVAHLYRAQGLLPTDRPVDFIDYILVSRLGSAAYKMGEYAQAAQWWSKAADLQHVAPRLQRLELQVFWARLETALGHPESARSRCMTVLPAAREHNIKLTQIFALNELGHIALILGAGDDADVYFGEARAGCGADRTVDRGCQGFNRVG